MSEWKGRKVKNEKLERMLEKKETTLIEAMERLDKTGKGILFIVNEEEQVIGTLTDGDVRRWLLKCGDIHSDVGMVMRRNPRIIRQDDKVDPYEYMEQQRIDAVPIVNPEGKIVDIVYRTYRYENKSVKNKALKNVPIVIMAGGKGTRLYPYTKILPKPLIPIGDIPIIERIMNKFYEYGATEFFITVNYKQEMMRAYFAEANLPYGIKYVKEDKPLGTAGSIRLITEELRQPLIITNCDILIETSYDALVEYHLESGNDMTIVSSLKNTKLPYGVIHCKEGSLVQSIEEKPTYSNFINTGMYIINPEYIKWIPENKMYHMTDLAQKMLDSNKKIGMYPISENSFLDMGQFEELKRMEEIIGGGKTN